MPTTRGWAALGAAVALIVLWIGFGERLLLAVGAFLVLAIAVGLLYVRAAVPRVAISRKITPIQVHDGDRSIVELTLVAKRPLLQVVLQDHVERLGSARFVASRVDPDAPLHGRYEILCRPRGVYRVGPAEVVVRDPLGLVESGGSAGRPDRLVVYPAVEDLQGLPLVRGQDPNLNSSKANFSPAGGEDFFTLREYQRGDDLRHVHWPSSAKRDDLMIKQLEMPWQSRAMVLLDVRSSQYPDRTSFEQAVRGAASVTRHLYRKGFGPTLWTGNVTGTPVMTSEGYTKAMEELAIVQPTDRVDLRQLVNRMRRSGVAGGALVMVTGVPDETGMAAYQALSRDFVRSIVMAVAQNAGDGILQLTRSGAITVVVSPTAAWAPAWQEAMERAWSTATAG